MYWLDDRWSDYQEKLAEHAPDTQKPLSTMTTNSFDYRFVEDLTDYQHDRKSNLSTRELLLYLFAHIMIL